MVSTLATLSSPEPRKKKKKTSGIGTAWELLQLGRCWRTWLLDLSRGDEDPRMLHVWSTVRAMAITFNW